MILEAADSVGSAWRNRWDSLVLFTPRRSDALPGLAFPGDPDGYPTRDEVAAYLEQYAGHLELPVQLSSRRPCRSACSVQPEPGQPPEQVATDPTPQAAGITEGAF